MEDLKARLEMRMKQKGIKIKKVITASCVLFSTICMSGRGDRQGRRRFFASAVASECRKLTEPPT